MWKNLRKSVGSFLDKDISASRLKSFETPDHKTNKAISKINLKPDQDSISNILADLAPVKSHFPHKIEPNKAQNSGAELKLHSGRMKFLK